jgi:chloramphenicol-sensitive protein RarD
VKNNEMKKGILYAVFSYLLWGLLPIYWKLLGNVQADEILANRVIWSFVFMLILIIATGKWSLFIETIKSFKENKKLFWALVIASILISCNWYIYIWAVNHGHIVQTSLGYYINPLVSVLLGIIFLKERLSKAQSLSFLLAAAGVLILSLSYHQFPWVALLLALTFGFYGLAKKLIKVDSAIGLALETMVVTPIALIYVLGLFMQGQQSFLTVSYTTDFLLIGAGAATAVPLLYFAKGAQIIPLSMLGFVQYISPTITLILGVFVYGEEFTKVHLLSFLCIWTALTLYSLSSSKFLKNLETKRRGKKELEVENEIKMRM